MALPTVTKTWQYSVNNRWGGQTPGAGQLQIEADVGEMLWHIKDSLTGFSSNPWAVIASSDGSTAGLSDLWTTYQNVEWNSSGNRSWILLRQSQIATNFELLFDCQASNGSAYLGRWYVCIDGFNTTSIAPDTPPVANSARTWKLNLDNTIYTRMGRTSNSSAEAGRVHIMMDTTGKLTRIVSCQFGLAKNFLLIDAPDDATVWTPGWTDPTVVLQRAFDTSERCTYTYMNDDVAGYGYYEGTYNNTFNLYLTSEMHTSDMIGQLYTFPDDQTGEWPMCPIGLYSSSVGMQGPRRASLTDIWWGSTAIKTGDCYPITPTDSKEFVQFGDLILPWNGTTPLVW